MPDSLFVGLDVGTDSVGWAATDEDFHLLRIKGKTAWGSRLFEEASDAKTRRMNRTAKRRLERRKERVAWLETLFVEELNEVDPGFLLRLHNSAFYVEDRPVGAQADSLIFPTRKEEKAFYAKYPTIWHLRNAMIHDEPDAFSDIRLLYLAIHHIIKYRGNFLKEGAFSTDGFEDEVFEQLNACLSLLCSTLDNEAEDEEDSEASSVYLSSTQFEQFRAFVREKEWDKRTKKKKLLELFTFEKASPVVPYLDMFCTLAVGGEFDIKKLGPDFESQKVSLDGDFDAVAAGFASTLGDAFDLLKVAKIIYDDTLLYEILHDSDSLSASFVRVYETFKEDKKALKFLVHSLDAKAGLTRDGSLYYKIFLDSNTDNNYPYFINGKPSKEGKNPKKRRQDIHAFNKFIQATIDPYVNLMSEEEVAVWEQLKVKIANNTLFKTISLCSTSVIPMQLHQEELKKILKNAIAHGYFFVKDIQDKVLKLFEFRIPYFCGPLGQKDGVSGRSNVVFVEGSKKERITPWNFESKVDLIKTKEKFIGSLTNTCSYLFGKPVLPRGSLLFEEFDTFNRANGIRANSERLPAKDRELVCQFAFTRPKTSLPQIKKFLITNDISYGKDVLISGLSEVDGLSCPSHAFFAKKPFAWDLSDRNSKLYKEAERIIFLRTIFADCPRDGLEVIHNEFPELSEGQLKALNGLNPSGWASLSRELLTLPYGDESGEIQGCLIDLMEQEGRTFNEIFFDSKYGFAERVNAINAKTFGGMTVEDRIDEMLESTPPKMRRPVIQALRIVEEIARFSKKEPTYIAVEVTRAPDKTKKGKYTDSRRKQIEDFYTNLVKGAGEKGDIERLRKELASVSDDQLRGKHLFLYFIQNGRDLYTGLPIDINDVLSKDGPYDHDHIIPQSMMKDDSIENLVLVRRELNQKRSNIYPIPGFVCDRSKVVGLWKMLHKNKMMSDKKFENLMRTRPLSEEELSGFVEAQINVVNYANKVLKDVLQIRFPNSRVIFSKAKYPSLVRHDLGIPKIRTISDTHHAVDAYLNIITGVSLYRKFSDMRVVKAISKAQKENPEAAVKHSLNMEQYVRSMVVDKEGNPTEFGQFVLATSQRHDFLMTYRRSYSDSAFYDATLYSPKSKYANSLISLHSKEGSLYLNTARYGGYVNAPVAFNVIVHIHGKKERTIVASVSHLLFSRYGWNRKDELEGEIISQLNLASGETAEVDFQHILYNGTKLLVNGLPVLATNMNLKQINCKLFRPVYLSLDNARYLAKVMNIIESKKCDLSDPNEVAVTLDRDGQHVFIISREKNIRVLNEIRNLTNQPCYDGVGMICELRELLASPGFDCEMSLQNQIEEIRQYLYRFTRNSGTLTKKTFLLSKNVLCDKKKETKILIESLTGLYSKVEKL